MDPITDIKTLTATVDRLATGLHALFEGIKTLQGRIAATEERLNAVEYRYPPTPTLSFIDDASDDASEEEEQKVTLGCRCPFRAS